MDDFDAAASVGDLPGRRQPAARSTSSLRAVSMRAIPPPDAPPPRTPRGRGPRVHGHCAPVRPVREREVVVTTRRGCRGTTIRHHNSRSVSGRDGEAGPGRDGHRAAVIGWTVCRGSAAADSAAVYNKLHGRREQPGQKRRERVGSWRPPSMRSARRKKRPGCPRGAGTIVLYPENRRRVLLGGR